MGVPCERALDSTAELPRACPSHKDGGRASASWERQDAFPALFLLAFSLQVGTSPLHLPSLLIPGPRPDQH